VSYFIILLQDIKSTSAEQLLLEDQIDRYYFWLVIIVLSSSLILFLIIWGMTLKFTNQITNPIIELTKIAEMVKQATGKDSREKVMEIIESQPIFEQTKKLIL